MSAFCIVTKFSQQNAVVNSTLLRLRYVLLIYMLMRKSKSTLIIAGLRNGLKAFPILCKYMYCCCCFCFCWLVHSLIMKCIAMWSKTVYCDFQCPSTVYKHFPQKMRVTYVCTEWRSKGYSQSSTHSEENNHLRLCIYDRILHFWFHNDCTSSASYHPGYPWGRDVHH